MPPMTGQKAKMLAGELYFAWDGGDNTVVGAGSVVTKDLPAGVLAMGNPCRVVRAL